MSHLKHSNRRRRGPHQEPFAGIRQDPDSNNDGALSLAVYGLSTTLHPLNHVYDEEEQLVHWPEEDSEITVDRFDCRMLLDPSEIALRRPHPSTSVSANNNKAAALEAELDIYRYWDLEHPGSRYGPGEEEERSRSPSPGAHHGGRGYAAIGFTYEPFLDEPSTTQEFTFPAPLPPPPPCRLTSGVSFAEVAANSRPMSSRQLAIMRRAAEFVRRGGGDRAEEVLKIRMENDPSFAFLSPQHLQYEFFKGLIDRPTKYKEDRESERLIGRAEKVEEVNGLAMLGSYGDENEQGEEETVVTDNDGEQVEKEIVATAYLPNRREVAAMKRLLEAVQRTGPGVVALVKERLSSSEPLLSFLDNPESVQFMAFLVLAEPMLGKEGKEALAEALSKVSKAVTEEKEEETRIEGEESKEAVPVPGGGVPPWLLDRGLASSSGAAGAAPQLDTSAGRQSSLPASNPLEIEAGVEAEPEHEEKSSAADEAKKAERRLKARALLQERQEREAAAKRKQQQIAMQKMEEERRKQVAAISAHKQAFLYNSDSE